VRLVYKVENLIIEILVNSEVAIKPEDEYLLQLYKYVLLAINNIMSCGYYSRAVNIKAVAFSQTNMAEISNDIDNTEHFKGKY